MNRVFAFAIVATIVIGLAIDSLAAPWGQPVVDVVAWCLFFGLLAVSPPIERSAYLRCLALATAGEVALALVWGVYEYRLGNLPLFVPPGHVLLYALGRWVAQRVSIASSSFACSVVLGIGILFAGLGIDQLSLPLAVLFALCMRFGPAPDLYAVMFVLALAMEVLGTSLGNWTWQQHAPWLGWSTLNPPFAAGAFYCALDLLVGRTATRARSSPMSPARIL